MSAELLEALESQNIEQAVCIFRRDTSRSDALDARTALLDMDQGTRERCWHLMQNITRAALPALGHTQEEKEAAPAFEENQHANKQNCVFLLKGICLLVHSCLKSAKAPPGASVFGLCCDLHNSLLELTNVDASALQFQIARVCELWWTNEWPNRELLLTQLLPYQLSTSLAKGAKEADVKRVFHMREALALLDFDDEDIVHLRELILRVVACPLYLKSTEGRRFLAFVMDLHIPTAQMIHDVVRAQLPELSSRVSGMYGDVYGRAWKGATPEFALVIQERIQEFLFAAIHSRRESTFKSVRAFMASVQSQRDQLEKAILGVYGPILWRALKCSHAVVRLHALTLFFDAFPLLDRGATGAETERLQQMQYDVMSGLLRDDDYRVRAACVTGVCHTLRVFCETIPLENQKPMVAYICGTLAFDVAHPHVRLAVLHGVSEMLDNTLAHGVMKHVLPQLANLIHDRHVVVRVAFIKLLHKIKGISGWRFTDVVPLEVLLARLRLDASRPSVALQITSLLLHSFYPISSSTQAGEPKESNGSEQLKRCLAFVVKCPIAAAVFYKYLHKHASVGSSVKMCVLLLRCLAYDHDTDSTRSKNEESKRGILSEVPIRSHLFGLIATLLESVQSFLHLPANSSSLQMLNDHFTQEACNVLYDSVYPSTVGSSLPQTNAIVNLLKVLALLSTILKVNVDGLSERPDQLFNALAAQYSVLNWEQLGPQVQSLTHYVCATEQEELLVDFASVAFQSIAQEKHAQRGKRSRKRRKSSACPVYNQDHLRMCIDLLASLLRDTAAPTVAGRERLLQNSAQVMQLRATLLWGRDICMKQQQLHDPIDPNDVILPLALEAMQLLWELELHLCIRASYSNGEDEGADLLALMKWTTESVLPNVMLVCSCAERQSDREQEVEPAERYAPQCKHALAERLMSMAIVVAAEATLHGCIAVESCTCAFDAWSHCILASVNASNCESGLMLGSTTSGSAVCRLAYQISLRGVSVPTTLIKSLLTMCSSSREKRSHKNSADLQCPETAHQSTHSSAKFAYKALSTILSAKACSEDAVRTCCEYITSNLKSTDPVSDDRDPQTVYSIRSLSDLAWRSRSAVAVCECLCEHPRACKQALDLLSSWCCTYTNVSQQIPVEAALSLIGGFRTFGRSPKSVQDYAAQIYDRVRSSIHHEKPLHETSTADIRAPLADISLQLQRDEGRREGI